MAGHYESDGSPKDFDFQLFPPAQGASEETEQLTRQMEEDERVALVEREQQLAKADSIVADWNAAVLGMVGAENWDRWMQYSREQRASLYGLKRPTPGPKGEAELAEAKRRAIDDSYLLMKEASIAPDELKALHRRYADALRDLLRPEEPKDPRLRIAGMEEYIALLRVIKEDPWTTRRPPYDGQLTVPCEVELYPSLSSSGVSRLEDRSYLDRATGSTGHRSRYRCDDAGDRTGTLDEWNTSVFVWYQTPRAGQLEIWMKVRCGSACSDLWLDDEWGWSESRTDVWSDIRLKLSVAPDIQHLDRHAVGTMYRTGNPSSESYHDSWCPAGAVLPFVFTSDPIPAGIMTCIKVGTWDRLSWRLNDVSADITIDSQWFVDEIRFRVV